VIRVLLAEEMKLLRGALVSVLSYEGDFDVVAEIDQGGMVVGAAGRVRPQVAVVDAHLPGLPDDLPGALGGCGLVVLACPGKPAAVRRMLSDAVLGLVSKAAAPDELVDAVRRVATGERVIDPTLALAALTTPDSPLTPREREVLRITAEGAPPEEVAGRLFLSERTVRNYLSAIVRKTGARTRLEVVRMAEDAGWL